MAAEMAAGGRLVGAMLQTKIAQCNDLEWGMGELERCFAGRQTGKGKQIK